MAYRSRYSRSFERRRQSRRAFLGGLAALAALTAGGVGAWAAGWLQPVFNRGAGAATPGAVPPTAAGVTPKPGAAAAATSPAPPEPPLAVARRYLTAWEAGDYAAMYALLTPPAQARLGQPAFVDRYTAIKEEAGITKVTPSIAAGTAQDAAPVPYEVTIETRAGKVTERQQLPLAQGDGRWGVDWNPTLIFKELSGDRLVRFEPEPAVRGRILDRNGTVLAATGEAPLVGVVPAEVKNEAAMLEGLSKVLAMPPEAIKKKLSGGEPHWFMPIKRLSWTTQEPELVAIQKIAEGIQVRMVPERTYPQGPLAAHVVGYATEVQAEDLKKGYVAGDRIGRAGLEASAEKELAGERGGKLLIIERDGLPVVTLAQKKAKPGADVTLTLDLAVQKTAEVAMGDRRGAVIVMDPKDGGILALVSKPGFDPNSFVQGFTDEEWARLNDEKLRPLNNRATDGIYPPGSIFKVVTMTLGMEKLGMGPGESFQCNGNFRLPNAPQVWNDWKLDGHGRLNLVFGLTTSCDIVFYTIGQKSDIQDENLLPEVTRTFGLGKPTGLAELPEQAGNVPDDAWKRKTWNDPWARGDAINFSIGQGFLLVTPLQMAVIYTAIANGGTMWTPFLIQSRQTPGDAAVRPTEPKEKGKLPMQPATLAAIREGLNAVPTRLGGTGYVAFKDYTGPPAAGKTGTAETGTKGVYHAWFAAYAPQTEAKMTVICFVEEGRDTEGEGSRAAAPIARAIFEQNLANAPAAPKPGAKPAPAAPPPAPKPGAAAPTPASVAKPAPSPTRRP